MSKTDYDRFLKKVVITPGCWVWAGYANVAGYGVIRINGKRYTAHHYSFVEINKRVIPPKHILRHTCGTHRCVNPSHLEVVARVDLFG